MIYYNENDPKAAAWLRVLIPLAVACALSACGGGTTSSQAPALAPEPTVATPHYGSVGAGPPIVVLALDEQDTLYNSASTGGVVPALVGAGYTVVSLDLPCHGADAEPGVAPLDCWAQRLHAGDTELFTRFCAGLSKVLDAEHIERAGILGISRGGYMATTCAAYEPRFTAIVLENPVTDLNYLAEFKGLEVNEQLFSLQQYVPYLTGDRIMLSIDAIDDRVGASLAEAFAGEIHAKLEVTDAPDHTITPAVAAAAATWFIEENGL